jgi:hypothetical protein
LQDRKRIPDGKEGRTNGREGVNEGRSLGLDRRVGLSGLVVLVARVNDVVQRVKDRSVHDRHGELKVGEAVRSGEEKEGRERVGGLAR